MSNRKLPSKGQGSSERKRPAGKRRELPRHLRRAAALLSKTLGIALRDFCYTCLKAGIDISTITRAAVDLAAEVLVASGGSTAGSRITAWRRAIDALPEDAKRQSKITEQMVNPKGKRILSEPDGTFVPLEADLNAVMADATRPCADKYEEHVPVKHTTADAAKKRILILAATLYRKGLVGQDIRLADLLTVEMQVAFIEAALDRVRPSSNAGDDEAAGDEEAEANGPDLTPADRDAVKAAKKGVWIGEDLGAIIFFAARLWGKDCDAVVFAKAQRREWGSTTGMTTAHVLTLARLTQPSQIRRLRALIPLLLSLAESENHFQGSKRVAARLRSANIAALIAIELELLLRPTSLWRLACQSDEAVLIIPLPKGAERRVSWADLSMATQNVLRRREVLMSKLGKSSNWLLPGANGDDVQDTTSVCTSLAKITKAHGLSGITMQMLRDVGAVALIRDDRKKLRRVMVMLGFKSIRTVLQRYAPFLKDVTND